MAAKDHDRNLLFGILALQLDFISRESLVAAMHAWVLSKDRPLGEILVEQKVLPIERRTLLEALVDEHLKQHANDAEKSLAAVSSLGSVRDELRQIDDRELQATLVQVSIASPQNDPHAATELFAGSATLQGTRFRILRPHAVGGLGKVSVARDEELSREVALKEIQEQFADNPDSRARFLLEAEITGSLEHPGVVPVYGLGQYADGRPYYAMRFIRGDSLKEAIGRYHDPKADISNVGERAIELRKLLGRFLDVCNAIAYAHSRGVLHRDLKPGNIMLGKYGETLVVDWGLAKTMDRPEIAIESSQAPIRPSLSSGSASTQFGAALGTPRYMSPEQATGRLDLLGPASDVYSLGATLFCVLTGRPPIEGDDPGEILRRVEHGQFPAPRAVNAEVAPPLDSICLKAMALRPADRYQSPRDLADDIEHWLADEPVTAHRDTALARVSRSARRHKVITAAAAAVLLAAVFALSIGTALIGREQARTDKARRDAVAAKATTEQANQELGKTNADLDAARKKANRQLALSYIDRGVNELERGDPFLGYAILGQAYRASSDTPDLRRSVLSLLAAWDAYLPRVLIHDGRVTDVCFSPDGAKIATRCAKEGGGTGTRLWNATTGKPIGEALDLGGIVSTFSFSPDGKQIATLNSDGSVQHWDTAAGKPLGEPMYFGDNFEAASFSPDGTKIAIASNTKSKMRDARIWDVATGNPLTPSLVSAAYVDSMVFSPDGTKIAIGSIRGDGTSNMGEARIWDVATGTPLTAPLKHPRSIPLCFSADGTKIATTGDYQTAIIWDTSTGKAIGSPLRNMDGLCYVAFSPDGTTLATADKNGVRLWDLATGKVVGSLKHYRYRLQPGYSILFSPDGTKVATASDDEVRLWDAATCKPVGSPLKYHEYVTHVSFSRDGTRVASAAGNTVRLWDEAACKRFAAPMKRDFPETSVVWCSPDGAMIAAQDWDHTVRIWQSGPWKPIGTPLKFDRDLPDPLFSPNGAKGAAIVKRYSSASWSCEVHLWDVATGKRFATPLKFDGFRNCRFSTDGSKFAAATQGDDLDVRLWEVETGKLLRITRISDRFRHDVVFSPSATTIAALSDSLRLWDIETGKPGPTFGDKGNISSAYFSHDGTIIAVCFKDETVRLYDVLRGRPICAPLKNDGGIIGQLVFSPDDTRIATTNDATARVWEVATGKELVAPFRLESSVYSVSFSPDGTKILTVSGGPSVRLWDLGTGKPLGPQITYEGDASARFCADDTIITGGGDLLDVRKDFFDDPIRISAFVEMISQFKEGADCSLHAIGSNEVHLNWDDVLRSRYGQSSKRHGLNRAGDDFIGRKPAVRTRRESGLPPAFTFAA